MALLALLGFTLALAAPEAPVQGDQPPAAGLPGEEATEQAQEEVGNEGVSSEAEVVEADESPPQQQQQQQPQEEAKEAKEAAVEDIREHLVSHLKEAIENGKVRVFVQSQVVQKEQGLDVDTFAAGGSLDSFERDNHFIVGVSSASRPLSSSGAKPPSSEKHRKVRVTNYEGVELECVVPVVPQQSQEESSEAAMADAKSSEDAWDDSEFEERASKLLGTDTLKNCHRKVDGWWTYEVSAQPFPPPNSLSPSHRLSSKLSASLSRTQVCPLAHVRQYHAENNQILSSFNLGTFNATKTIERFRKRKGQR